MPSKEDRATATGNKQENLVEFGRAVSEIRQQTDKQTDLSVATICDGDA